MKALLIVGFLAASVAANVDTKGNAVPQYAEARESFDSTAYVPTQYNSDPYYSTEPGFSFGANVGASNGGLYLPDLITTGLNIVLGIFFFSLIIQIVSKVLDSDLFPNLLDTGRSLSSSEIIDLTNKAMAAYKKYEELNTPK